MKHLIYIALIIFCFSSCKTAKVKTETVRTVTDSITSKVTHEIKRDTIRIAADTVKISVPIANLTETPVLVTSEAGRIKASLRRINDNVEVDCYVDELLKIIESQNTIIETLTKRTDKTDTTVTEVEYKTPWYSKTLNVIAVIAILYIAIRFKLF